MVSKRLATICLLIVGALLALSLCGCKQRGGQHGGPDAFVLSEKGTTDEAAGGGRGERVAQEPAESGEQGESAKAKAPEAEAKTKAPAKPQPEREAAKPAPKPPPRTEEEAAAGAATQPKPQPTKKAEAEPEPSGAGGAGKPTASERGDEAKEKKPEAAREKAPDESEAAPQKPPPTPASLAATLQGARDEAKAGIGRARQAADRSFLLALLALGAALWALIPALLRKRREEQPTDSASAVLDGLFEAWLWRPLALMGRREQQRLVDIWKRSGAKSPVLPANIPRSDRSLRDFAQRLRQWSANVQEVQAKAADGDPELAASLTAVRRLAEQCNVSCTDQEGEQQAIRRECEDPDVSRVSSAVGRVRRDMGDYESWLMQRVEKLPPSEAGALLGPDGFREYVAQARGEILDRWSKTATHVEEARQSELRQSSVNKRLRQWAGHLLELRTRAHAMQRQLDDANPSTAEGLTTVQNLKVIVSGVTGALDKAMAEAGLEQYSPPANVRLADLREEWQQRSVEVLPTTVPMRTQEHHVGAVAEVAEPAWVLRVGDSDDRLTVRTAKVKLFSPLQAATGAGPGAPAPAPAPAGTPPGEAEAPPAAQPAAPPPVDTSSGEPTAASAAARPAAPAPADTSPGEPTAAPGPAPSAAGPLPAAPAGAPATGVPAAEAPAGQAATQPAEGVGAEVGDQGTGAAAEEEPREEGKAGLLGRVFGIFGRSPTER